MVKDLLIGLIVIVSITIIFNAYYGRELSSSTEFNEMITSINNNILPEKEILEEGYQIQCISDIPNESSINNKKKVIQYYLGSGNTLSFSCGTEFYKRDNSLNNLIELESKVKNICYINNTKGIKNSYFCTKKD